MSVTAYASYAEFTSVYSLRGVTQEEISTYWLPYGALRTNEALGGFFGTLPFSSNNETAKDLSIHLAYVGILARQRTGSPEENKVKAELNARIESIRNGNTPMILTDGSAIYADTARIDVWSTTQDFENVFNVLPAEQQMVDIDLIEDLQNRVF